MLPSENNYLTFSTHVNKQV